MAKHRQDGERVSLRFEVAPELYRRLRIAAAVRNVTMVQLVQEALERELGGRRRRKRGEPK